MPEYQPKLVTGGVRGAVLLNKPHHHFSLTERKSLLGFALDHSGSMSPLAAVALQSLNQLVDQQETLSGDSCFTLTLFNNDVALIHDAVALRDVPPLLPGHYEPSSRERPHTAKVNGVGVSPWCGVPGGGPGRSPRGRRRGCLFRSFGCSL